MNDHNVNPLAQALRCLGPLVKLVPETVKLHIEVSGVLVVVAVVVAVWLIG